MQANRLPLLRTTLIAGLGLLIAWQVATRSVAAYLARESPQAALKLNAGEPTALVNLSEARLNRRTAEPSDSGGIAVQPSDKGGPPGDRLRDWSEIALKAIVQKLDQGKDSASGVPRPR